MRALLAGDLLRLWDACRDAPATERALALAGAADGDGDEDGEDGGTVVLADRPVGRVTALLLRLRTALAGPQMAAVVTCPACRRPVEFQASAAPLLALEDKIVDTPPPLLHSGYEAVWRCPSYGDLLALAEQPGADDPERGAALLLDRCVLGLRHEESAARGKDPRVEAATPTAAAAPMGTTPPTGTAGLPETVLAALSDAMSAADPLADVLVDLRCPDCEGEFTAGFDVAAFVWAEIESRAQRLLLDVDALARAYGWSESAVLALPEPRRAAYIRLVTGDLP